MIFMAINTFGILITSIHFVSISTFLHTSPYSPLTIVHCLQYFSSDESSCMSLKWSKRLLCFYPYVQFFLIQMYHFSKASAVGCRLPRLSSVIWYVCTITKYGALSIIILDSSCQIIKLFSFSSHPYCLLSKFINTA